MRRPGERNIELFPLSLRCIFCGTIIGEGLGEDFFLKALQGWFYDCEKDIAICPICLELEVPTSNGRTKTMNRYNNSSSSEKKTITDKINKANKLLKEYQPIAEDIARAIVEALKDVVELDWSLGWCEAGIDTICFYYKNNKDMPENRYDESLVSLDKIIEEVFPEFKYASNNRLKIDTPFGVYLSGEAVAKAREQLIKLRNKNQEDAREPVNT